MYQTLLFDIDDTILDFEDGELRSLTTALTDYHLPTTPAVIAAYLKLNAFLWTEYEAGRISREQIFARRFTELFAQFHLAADGLAAEHHYHRLLDQEAVVARHAADTLAALGDYRLYIVSNGIEAVQQARLTKAGLIDQFSDLFVSDAIGVPKPSVAFFDYVAKHIPDYDAATTLIMGDSLTSDIQGGVNAGLDTIWYNPRFKPNRSHLVPTYQLSDWADLPQLLAGPAV